MINKHKSNKIKENSNTVRHLNNGTDHRHSKSCCDKSSPARRTMRKSRAWESYLWTLFHVVLPHHNHENSWNNLWPLLLTRINFNLSMDEYSHTQWSEGWNNLSFPNVNGVTVEVWKWISNFIPYFIMDVITYPCLNQSWSMLVKGTPCFGTAWDILQLQAQMFSRCVCFW